MLADIVLLETNFVVEFDYNITAHGSSGTAPSFNYPGDPPEGCEYDLEVLALYKKHEKKELEFPNWLKDLVAECLYNSDEVNNKIQEADADRSCDYED